MIEMVAAGYKLFLILIALVKRALLTPGIRAHEKLEFLEGLERLPDNYLMPEMVAMIEPMCDKGYAIYAEAKRLDPPGDKTGNASFAVLTSERVFGHFVTLNPSILNAIRWREAKRTSASVSTASSHVPPTLPAAVVPNRPPIYGNEIPERFLRG
jgi:hypothetical protein